MKFFPAAVFIAISLLLLAATSLAEEKAGVEQKPAQPAVKQEEPKKEAAPVKAESKSVQIQVRRLVDKLAKAFEAKFPGEARYQRLAVAGFNESGDLAKSKQLGKVVENLVTTYFSRDHEYILVERENIDKVLKENEFALSDLASDEAASKVGQLLEAQALVMGTVSEVGAHFVVNARLVDTFKGTTLVADSAQIPAEGLVALSSRAVVLKSKGGAALWSTLLPGAGQYYNGQSLKAAAFLGAEAAILGGALYFGLKSRNTENDYNKLSESECSTSTDDCGRKAQKLRDDYHAQTTTVNVLLLVAAGVWGVNVIDAYANGYEPRKENELAGEPKANGRMAAFTVPSNGGIGVGFSLSY